MLHWIFGSLVRILNTHVCQDMKGNVRVFCRFRPLTKREEDLGDIPVLHKVDWQCWTGLWICHIIVVMLHGKNTRSVWFLACLHPRKLIVMLPKALSIESLRWMPVFLRLTCGIYFNRDRSFPCLKTHPFYRETCFQMLFFERGAIC